MCPDDLLVCACSQVPIKVNKTNCYVSIRGCFSSCCKFRGWTVYPTLFSCVCVCVCGYVWLCLFLLLRHPPSVSEHARVRGHNNWATPWFFDVVRHTDARTNMRSCTHTHTQTKVKSRQTALTLKALCLRLLSLKALTAKEKKQGRDFAVLVSALWCVLMFATFTLAGFDYSP